MELLIAGLVGFVYVLVGFALGYRAGWRRGHEVGARSRRTDPLTQEAAAWTEGYLTGRGERRCER